MPARSWVCPTDADVQRFYEALPGINRGRRQVVLILLPGSLLMTTWLGVPNLALIAAAATVAVLTADRPTPGVVELGGDEAWTLADLAAAVAAETGREVSYRDLPAAEHVAALVEVGLPVGTAEFVAGLDQAIAQGALDTGSHALSELTGRPTTTLAEHVHTVLSR